MLTERTEDDIKQSIQNLLAEAEGFAGDGARAGSRAGSHNLSEAELRERLDGLDLLISQEAGATLSGNGVTDAAARMTDDMIRDAVSEKVAEEMPKIVQEAIAKILPQTIIDISQPLLKQWIEKHLSEIAHAAVTEAIGKVATVELPQ